MAQTRSAQMQVMTRRIASILLLVGGTVLLTLNVLLIITTGRDMTGGVVYSEDGLVSFSVPAEHAPQP